MSARFWRVSRASPYFFIEKGVNKMKKIYIDMTLTSDIILQAAEETYPSALEQIQKMGVLPEDAPKVLYAIGFCKAAEITHQSMCETVEQLLTDIKESIENNEDFSVDYTNKKEIFTEEDINEHKHFS